GDALSVLPANRVQCEEGAQRVAILLRGLTPVLLHRIPRLLAQAFFIGVAVLRDDGGDALRMRKGEAEAGGRAVIEDIDGVAREAEFFDEGVDGCRQRVEGVAVLPLRRYFGEAEAGKVGRDHAIARCEARHELAEHERRGWKAVQKQQHRGVGGTGFAIEELHAIDFYEMDGGKVCGGICSGGCWDGVMLYGISTCM